MSHLVAAADRDDLLADGDRGADRLLPDELHESGPRGGGDLDGRIQGSVGTEHADISSIVVPFCWPIARPPGLR
jgi:hypothetical protein